MGRWRDDALHFSLQQHLLFLARGPLDDIEPEKFCRYTTGYSWPLDHEEKPVMPPQEDIDYVLNAVSNIFIGEKQMRYMMTLFSANLEGENVFREVYFVTGGAIEHNMAAMAKAFFLTSLGVRLVMTRGGRGFLWANEPGNVPDCQKGRGT
jgi:hypothetical protein